MILRFEDFVNEKLTLNDIHARSDKYAQTVYNKDMMAHFNRILLTLNDHPTEKDYVLAMMHKFEAGQYYDSYDISREIYTLTKDESRGLPKEATEAIMAMVYHVGNNRYSDTHRKAKDYLTQKYHKDINMDLHGDPESKFLYHYTTIKGLKGIVTGDTVHTHIDYEGDSGQDGACFTTDPDLYTKGFAFWYNERTDKTCGIRIKLDFAKIKADGYEFYMGDSGIGSEEGENEIRIKGELHNVSRYILSVEVYPNKTKAHGEDYRDAIQTLQTAGIRYRVKA